MKKVPKFKCVRNDANFICIYSNRSERCCINQWKAERCIGNLFFFFSYSFYLSLSLKYSLILDIFLFNQLDCWEGYIGENCRQPCPDERFGHFCLELCNCSGNEICDVRYGCLGNFYFCYI